MTFVEFTLFGNGAPVYVNIDNNAVLYVTKAGSGGAQIQTTAVMLYVRETVEEVIQAIVLAVKNKQ